MKSMTGFGRAEMTCPNSGIHFSAEVSGVNRKQLDVRVGLPRELQFFEIQIREAVQQYISRGTVLIRLDFRMEKTVNQAVRVDYDAADQLMKEAETLSTRYGLTEKLAIYDLLSLPGVVVPVQVDFSSPESEKTMMCCVRGALDAFNAMREREGENLKCDFIARLDLLSNETERLQQLTDGLSGIFRERILQKIKEAEVTFAADEDRLMKEVFFLCQKADVAEELTRLRSHIGQMRDNLSLPQGGRKLDFIVQEMHREITTLGNKAPGIEVTPIIVNFKTEIDRMKEQVQNVE